MGKWFAWVLLLAGGLVMGCSDADDSTPSDGDTDQAAEQEGDATTEEDPDEAAVEEDATTEEEDAAEEEEEATAAGSRCVQGVTSNDRKISADKGGRAQICDPDDSLDGSGVSFVADDLLEDIHILIKAGDPVVIDGWTAVGPAVYFQATPESEGGQVKLEDVAEFTLPFNTGELPELARDFHINIAVQIDPAVSGRASDPALLPKDPVAVVIDRERQILKVKTVFLGTFQVVVPTTILPPASRRYTYRALAGISMGAGAAAITGMRYHEKFDIIGPMGGIMDMGYLLNLMHHEHLGGFCSYDAITGAEDVNAFVTDTEQACGYCGPQTDPNMWSEPVEKCYMVEPREMYADDEHAQGYNHWYYDDNGGNFNRNEYVKLFRDLSYSYGNVTSYNPESPYLAAGLTGERLQKYLSDVYYQDQPTGCANLAAWMATDPMAKFYDREFNPNGTYPAIHYCDGVSQRTGDWNPADGEARAKRLDIGVAIDFNGNGIRDYGEPPVRQFWEPFQDCGLDGLCDASEPGYDATTNPDPNHDDYNPYQNPLGTEGNGLYDAPQGEAPGESYEDVGIDGVACPQDETCPFDYGEGNTQFDYNPNVARYLDHDPRLRVLKATDDELKRLNFWMDAGIRDIFNFVLMADNLMGSLRGRLDPLGLVSRSVNDFITLPDPDVDLLSQFQFQRVNYSGLGQNVLVRYGSYVADDDFVRGGDGRHVGFPTQVIFRVQTFYAFCNVNFPNGDYEKVESASARTLLQKGHYYSNVLRRYQKFSVALPPGYFTYNQDGTDGAPDVCDDAHRFPVIYLMHGYGQKPEDLAAAIPILFNFMYQGQFQKLITIFPDGECDSVGYCQDDCEDECNNAPDKETCRSECETRLGCADRITECAKGTFYANHVATDSHPLTSQNTEDPTFLEAQTEDSLLEIMEYVDQNFCTKREEVVQVDGATMKPLY